MERFELDILKALKEQEERRKRFLKTTVKKKALYPLLGFSSEFNSIKLDDDTIIKKVSKKFLLKEIYGIKDVKDEFFNSKHYEDFQFIASYVFIEARKIHHGENINRRDLLLAFFRIHQLYSLDIRNVRNYVFVERNRKKSFQSVGITTLNRPPSDYLYSNEYKVLKKDIGNFKKLWRNLMIALKNNKPLGIAIRRFNYSFERYDYEDKIIDLLICLEALFLRQEAELKFRLSLRIATFLSPQFNLKETYELIGRMYDIRSKLVHGMDINPKLLRLNGVQYDLSFLTWKLYEIIRNAMRKYLLSDPKMDIIKSIDNTIIGSDYVK